MGAKTELIPKVFAAIAVLLLSVSLAALLATLNAEPALAEETSAQDADSGLMAGSIDEGDSLEADDVELSDQGTSTGDMYAAYYEKVLYYLGKYGSPAINDRGNNVRDMNGLCLVALIDFDSDGTEELLLCYYDPSRVTNNWSMNDASAYVCEVWGYQNGTIKKLFEGHTQWTNGGFAYIYTGTITSRTSSNTANARVGETFIYTIDYASAGGTQTYRAMFKRGASFSAATTAKVTGIYTSSTKYYIDGKQATRNDISNFPTPQVGYYTKKSYSLMQASNQSSSSTSMLPSQVLSLTNSTIAKLKNNRTTSTGSKSMYRLYNPNSGEHFYTASAKERDGLKKVGWKYEGVGWTAPVDGIMPVYRLYNPNAGEHHYTTSANESSGLVKAGWRYEGIGWDSAPVSATKVYREYNPNKYSCNHNYTTSKNEHNWLKSLGWKDEGVAWYGL